MIFSPTCRAVLKKYQASAPATPDDPYWSNVVTVWHADGTNGQNTGFVDSGPLGLTINNSGSYLALTTAAPKFGTANLNTGSASGWKHVYIGQPHNFSVADKQDFTLEFWHKKSANTYDASVNTYGGYPASHYGIGFITPTSPAAFYYEFVVANASKGAAQIATASVYNNQWQHVAIVRSGSSANCCKMYLNGVMGAQSTYTGAISASSGLNIGGGYYGTSAASTQIDEVRFTLGVCRYTGSFPVPTAAFPSL